MENNETNDLIKSTLLGKAALKQDVFINTQDHFNTFKTTLKDLTDYFVKEVSAKDSRIKISYIDKGNFEAQVYFASDVLLFQMHTNVFQFDGDNPLWKTHYLKEDSDRGYCGIINVYNFLADSFRYNRSNDLGYLIARIFINKDNHFMVQGKRQLGFLYNDFINSKMDKNSILAVCQSILLYAIDFDLYTPPYDAVKEVTLGELQALSDNIKLQTGKRLGFKFQSDNDELL